MIVGMKTKLFNKILNIVIFCTILISCNQKDVSETEYCNDTNDICFINSKKLNNSESIPMFESISSIFKKNKFIFLHEKNNDKFVLFEPLNMYDVIFINDDHQKIIVKKHGVTINEFTSLEKLYIRNLFNDLFSNKVCKKLSRIYLRMNLPTEIGNKNLNTSPPPRPPLSDELDTNF